MIALDIRLELSEELARKAEAIGLLTPLSIESLIREEVRRRADSPSSGAAGEVLEIELPPATRAEVEATFRHLLLHPRRVRGPEKLMELIVEENTEPAAIAQNRARHENALRNARWLQSHRSDLPPGAIGKFVAVAGQEAFVAGTASGAQALAEAAHPEDDGVLVQYIRSIRGPGTDAHRG
jgi:hypothetical protein